MCAGVRAWFCQTHIGEDAGRQQAGMQAGSMRGSCRQTAFECRQAALARCPGDESAGCPLPIEQPLPAGGSMRNTFSNCSTKAGAAGLSPSVILPRRYVTTLYSPSWRSRTNRRRSGVIAGACEKRGVSTTCRVVNPVQPVVPLAHKQAALCTIGEHVEKRCHGMQVRE